MARRSVVEMLGEGSPKTAPRQSIQGWPLFSGGQRRGCRPFSGDGGIRWDLDSGEKKQSSGSCIPETCLGQARSLSQSLQFRGMCVSQEHTHTIQFT